MAFIAKNPMIAPIADSTPPTPLPGTRGLFPTENGWADIDENGNLILLAQKKIKSDEIDGLNSDNGYTKSELLVVEEVEGSDHPSNACYYVLTAYYGDDITENIQYKFNWDGRLSKRIYTAGDSLEDGSYEHYWSEWSIIGGGGIQIVDQNYNSNSSNAQSGKAVAQAIAQLVNGSPEALDTIYELAKALGDDPNFATTVMDMIGNKANESDLIDIVSGATMVGFAATAAADQNGNTIHETYARKADVGNIDDLSEHLDSTNLVDAINRLHDDNLQLSNGVGQAFDDVYKTCATKAELHPTPITTLPSTLTANTPYNLGEQTELSLLFPTTANDGDVIYITFESAETSTNLTVDTTNTSDFDLIPEVNTGYEIYAKYNGSIWIVKYSEYTKSEVA